MSEYEFQRYLEQRLKFRESEISANHKQIRVSIPAQYESEIVATAHRLREQERQSRIAEIEKEERERFAWIKENQALGQSIPIDKKPKRRKWNFDNMPQSIDCDTQQEAEQIRNNALAAAYNKNKKISTKIVRKENNFSVLLDCHPNELGTP